MEGVICNLQYLDVTSSDGEISDYYSDDNGGSSTASSTSISQEQIEKSKTNVQQQQQQHQQRRRRRRCSEKKQEQGNFETDSIDLAKLREFVKNPNPDCCFETDSIDLVKVKRHNESMTCQIDVDDDESLSSLEFDVPLKSCDLAKGLDGSYSNLNEYFMKPILKRNSKSNAAA